MGDDYEDDGDNCWPDGMQPDWDEECFACGGPCGRRGGNLCDPRCADCNPGRNP